MFALNLFIINILTEVRINPLHLLFNISSNALEISVNNSKFKLLTGGRFNVSKAMPVLSLTSMLTFFPADALDRHRARSVEVLFFSSDKVFTAFNIFVVINR